MKAMHGFGARIDMDQHTEAKRNHARNWCLLLQRAWRAPSAFLASKSVRHSVLGSVFKPTRTTSLTCKISSFHSGLCNYLWHGTRSSSIISPCVEGTAFPDENLRTLVSTFTSCGWGGIMHASHVPLIIIIIIIVIITSIIVVITETNISGAKVNLKPVLDLV